MYVNLASASKLKRAEQILTDIGPDGLMLVYTGAPTSPDLPSTETLLATLPLSHIAGVASFAVQQGAIITAGTSGIDGTYYLSFTGDGSGAAGYYIVNDHRLFSVTIVDGGYGYTMPPTIDGFANASLSGAVVQAVMTGQIRFNQIYATPAVASGTAGWARIVTADGVGVIDLDVGTTYTASVVMSNTMIAAGALVSCTAQALIEH